MTELSLTNKGPIHPAPELKAPIQTVSREIQNWHGVVAATHWTLYRPDAVDGADFYVSDREIGHIPTSPDLRDRLLDRREAERFPWGDAYAGWVQFRIRTESDACHAIQLFRMNYDRLPGSVVEEKTV